MQEIFVSIAAYRDPQCIPTIRDCLAKAHAPDRLRFGVCWQHAPNELGLPWRDDSRFRILDVPWQESRGACWARAEIMQLWAGEPVFLQLDSHHRFVQDWDSRLCDQLQATGSAQPVLSTYPPAFDPDAADLALGTEPLAIGCSGFTPEGIPVVQPIPFVLPDPPRPVPAHFVAGGFLAAPVRFVADVPYDPDLYFQGEEITLAIRAFTHGYDLFCPSEILVWHEYVRKSQPRHWDDHLPIGGVAVPWYERDAVSKKKITRFLSEPFVGPFGCGAARTFAEYEAYAGISFMDRTIRDEYHAAS